MKKRMVIRLEKGASEKRDIVTAFDASTGSVNLIENKIDYDLQPGDKVEVTQINNMLVRIENKL